MGKPFPPESIVTRGKVYAKRTGRYLGLVTDYDQNLPQEIMSALPDGEHLTLGELRRLAHEQLIPGYSKMSAEALRKALAGVGVVAWNPKDDSVSIEVPVGPDSFDVVPGEADPAVPSAEEEPDAEDSTEG